MQQPQIVKGAPKKNVAFSFSHTLSMISVSVLDGILG